MKSVRNIILWVSVFLGFFVDSFAREMPFTDIPTGSPYYNAVKYLLEQNIITDDGSHKFHGEDTMMRDTFVGLSVSVSCKKCITPTPDDIIRYQTSPFIDLSKGNPYFYCIAYAAEKDIVQGYNLDKGSGKVSCQNNQVYSSVPFCENNKITRIESAAVLMRQARLWDDIRNKDVKKTITISDISDYWYGYGVKGIQAWLLTLKPGNRLYSDEYITRGEFAIMAAKILSYNQCQTANDSRVASRIGVKDPTGKEVTITSFPIGYTGTLIPVTSTGSWLYDWTLTHPSTATTLTGSGTSFPISTMTQCGTWIGSLNVRDPVTGLIVSTSVATFFIVCPTLPVSISVNIWVSPSISVPLWTPLNFTPLIAGWSGTVTYNWNIGDGTTTTTANPTHTYLDPGTYTVTLTVVDSIGNTATTQVVITITWPNDEDNDGTIDTDDLCIRVFWPRVTNGCPIIPVFNPTTPPGNPPGNPTNSTPTGVPLISTTNSCIYGKSRNNGVIIATPTCIICPCDNSITMNALVRSCDILFPTILSVDQENVFSRWWFYQIP